MQMSFSVLADMGPASVVAEAAEVGEEPFGHVIALAAHEGDLFIRDDNVLQHLDLLLDKPGKAGRVDGVVTVYNHISYLRARVVVDDGTAHGELIKVVVGEMGDNLMHRVITFQKK